MKTKQSWTWSALGWEDSFPTAILPCLGLSSRLAIPLTHLFWVTPLKLDTERTSSPTSHFLAASQPKTQALSHLSGSASKDKGTHLFQQHIHKVLSFGLP